MWIPFINEDLSAFLSFQHHSRCNSQKCCTTSEGDAGDIDNFLVQSNNKQVSSLHFVCFLVQEVKQYVLPVVRVVQTIVADCLDNDLW